METQARADVVVIGLGAVGSATLYQLACRGVRAIGLDRFSPPHTSGSSHGETRITRQAVGEGTDYVPLVKASHRIWRELEAATGERLLTACGALVMGPGSGLTSHHGKPDFVSRTIAAARDHDIPHEVLTGHEVAARFPSFKGLSGTERACYEPGGGYVAPERCIAVQLEQAEALGASVQTGVAVEAIIAEPGHVRIETAEGAILADRVVVAAGGWTAPLLGRPFDQLLTVTRQLLHWFALEDLSAQWREAPVFIWMHGSGETDYLYGFPPLPGDDRVKVASEQYRFSATADTIDRHVSDAESAAMYHDHVEGRLAGVSPRVAAAAACFYTTTPDRGFIIDHHPDSERILVVSACSGHGFKHSAGIGMAAAELLTDGRSSIDLAPFSLSRFAVAA